MNNKYIENYLPYVIGILSVGSVYFQISEDGIGMTLYYSLWNNVLMVLSPFLLKRYPYLLFASASLTMTIYSVYETYLLIFGGMDYPWLEYRNFVGHYLCPVLIIFWCRLMKPKVRTSFKITIIPVTFYIFLITINILFVKLVAPLTDDIFPYFFMEYSKYGALPTIALIIVLFVLLRMYFIIYKNKIIK